MRNCRSPWPPESGPSATSPSRRCSSPGPGGGPFHKVSEPQPIHTPSGILPYQEESVRRWYIEVRDNGIGMSEALLVGPLLDFGTSYWNSPLMSREHPGLASSGFEPQGQYGIGFFSVFMWGGEVKVVTR